MSDDKHEKSITAKERISLILINESRFCRNKEWIEKVSLSRINYKIVWNEEIFG